MLSAETEAAVELVREQMPDAAVDFRGPYCKIERDGELDFDMAKLGGRLGRDIDTDTFLAVLLGEQHREHKHAPQRGELFADRAIMIWGGRHDPLPAIGKLARIEVIGAGLAIRFLLGTAQRS